MTDIDALDLTPAEAATLERVEEHPERLTADNATALWDLLAGSDESTREGVLLVLTRADLPVDPLPDMLEHDDHGVRAAAATALGHVTLEPPGDEAVAVVDGLYRALSDDHHEVRQAAATAIGRFAAGTDTAYGPDIEERLEERLDGRPAHPIAVRLDDRTNVAVAAGFAVFRTGTVDHDLRASARERLREGLAEQERPLLTSRLVAELAANGPVVHSMMRKTFYDDDVDGDPAVSDLVPDLVELLDRPDGDVRRHACRALGHLDSTAATADLERVAERDNQADVRIAAVEALERIRGTERATDDTPRPSSDE
ncbi:HEAT repeat domain-containing protein [Haloglomus halophilum]|uniref:HEAT repeat domain-containing protein n=1 Tax=Haloglomus halophilum TaxID=2962672 RepID=UPI0020C97D88|nr:HEAT repeat domain-containing protein [Haloglomus halophilum]